MERINFKLMNLLIIFFVMMIFLVGSGENNNYSIEENKTKILSNEFYNLNCTAIKLLKMYENYKEKETTYLNLLSLHQKIKEKLIYAKKKYIQNPTKENYEIYLNETKNFMKSAISILIAYNELLASYIEIGNIDEKSKAEIIEGINKSVKKLLMNKQNIENAKNFKNINETIENIKETISSMETNKMNIIYKTFENTIKDSIKNSIEKSALLNAELVRYKSRGIDVSKEEKELCELNKLINESYSNYTKISKKVNTSNMKELKESFASFVSIAEELNGAQNKMKNIEDNLAKKHILNENFSFLAEGSGYVKILMDGKVYIFLNGTLSTNTSNITVNNLNKINKDNITTYFGEGNVEIFENNTFIEINGLDISIDSIGSGNASLYGSGIYIYCHNKNCTRDLWNQNGTNVSFY